MGEQTPLFASLLPDSLGGEDRTRLVMPLFLTLRGDRTRLVVPLSPGGAGGTVRRGVCTPWVAGSCMRRGVYPPWGERSCMRRGVYPPWEEKSCMRRGVYPPWDRGWCIPGYTTYPPWYLYTYLGIYHPIHTLGTPVSPGTPGAVRYMYLGVLMRRDGALGSTLRIIR